MAFNPEPTRTPESIGNIVITLKDGFQTLEDGVTIIPYQAASYSFQIALSDGSISTRRGDCRDHLDAAMLQRWQDDLEAIRALIVSQVLPAP